MLPSPPRWINDFQCLIAAAALLPAVPVGAQTSATAHIEAGKKLVEETKCEACHRKKVGSDASAIYTRKDRRVNSLGKLLPQVARCNNELSLGLFPDDEAAIAAYLNAQYYKLKE